MDPIVHIITPPQSSPLSRSGRSMYHDVVCSRRTTSTPIYCLVIGHRDDRSRLHSWHSQVIFKTNAEARVGTLARFILSRIIHQHSAYITSTPSLQLERYQELFRSQCSHIGSGLRSPLDINRAMRRSRLPKRCLALALRIRSAMTCSSEVAEPNKCMGNLESFICKHLLSESLSFNCASILQRPNSSDYETSLVF